MIENRSNIADISYPGIGRMALFKTFIPSLIFLLFLPLLVNWIAGFFDLADRQLYSEYQLIYDHLTRPEYWFLGIQIVQLITLVIAILRRGPIASRQILEDNRGLFTTGFKAALSLWKWIFISVVVTWGFYGFVLWPKESFMDSLLAFLFSTVMYIVIPYAVLAITHSLLIAYCIGRTIKRSVLPGLRGDRKKEDS